MRGPVGGDKVRPGTFETEEEERRLWVSSDTHQCPHTRTSAAGVE